MKTLTEQFQTFVLQAPVTKTATFTGAAVEVDAGVNGPLTATVVVGAAAAAVGDTCIFTITGSPDNSTFTTVATLPGTAKGNGGGNEIAQVSFDRGLNRFFKLVATIVSASAPSFQYSGILQGAAVQQSGTLNTAALV